VEVSFFVRRPPPSPQEQFGKLVAIEYVTPSL
jgi:hypothetical protein